MVEGSAGTPQTHFQSIAILLIVILLTGCGVNGKPASDRDPNFMPRLNALRIVGAGDVASLEGGVTLSGAKNEWLSFAVSITNLPTTIRQGAIIRVTAMKSADGKTTIPAERLRAYQALPMPVDLNRAGYVRHTGNTAERKDLLRALLPLGMKDGEFPVQRLRDPATPESGGKTPAGEQSAIVWFDLQIPIETPSGEYTATIEVVSPQTKSAVSRVPLKLNVHDFVLSDERHLMMVGELDWDSLARLYPGRFEAVTPRLMNRADARYNDAIRTLDQLMALAQEHRAQLVIPRLQPIVKWPAGRPPQVDWAYYDALVAPWLRGDVFSDKVPLGFWNLPSVDGLSSFDPMSQRQYWSEIASHFDLNDWLTRSAVILDRPGRISGTEQVRMSAQARDVLVAHPRIRVMVSLEDDQVRFADDANPALIQKDWSQRLITANPGIVFNSPIRNWPLDVQRPSRWMRTDLTGLIPYVGAGGDERDVRLWAWLAFLPLPPPPMGVQYGPVTMIRWSDSLPRNNSASEPADPNDLIWFYPGSWFGIDEPVPSVQLKWMRRAQQDFEYLFLARQRGETINALVTARLMTKPVELQPTQGPDPAFGLMSGSTDAAAWDEALTLLARWILLREPGQAPDRDKTSALGLEMLRWVAPQERPFLLARTSKWAFDVDPRTQQQRLKLDLGVDIYNASDNRPENNLLQWNAPAPDGWEIRPQPIDIPALATYRVDRFTLSANIDPTRVRNLDPRQNQIVFTNGFDRRTTNVEFRLPVASSDRREGRLSIDGALNDWSVDGDAIHNGPLVVMFNRPAVQKLTLQPASQPTQIFTGWADEQFYVAFKVTGLASDDVTRVRNFVTYQFRRAWAEDVVQILVQPIYADNSVGPLLHVVCKPAGHWVEKRGDERQFADPWQSFEGTGIRYAATLAGQDWRAEVAIPWKAMSDPGKPRPVALRFNFTHHRHDIGQSASWAGPIDFGRDDSFMGVLYLREPETPGR